MFWFWCWRLGLDGSCRHLLLKILLLYPGRAHMELIMYLSEQQLEWKGLMKKGSYLLSADAYSHALLQLLMLRSVL